MIDIKKDILEFKKSSILKLITDILDLDYKIDLIDIIKGTYDLALVFNIKVDDTIIKVEADVLGRDTIYYIYLDSNLEAKLLSKLIPKIEFKYATLNVSKIYKNKIVVVSSNSPLYLVLRALVTILDTYVKIRDESIDEIYKKFDVIDKI